MVPRQRNDAEAGFFQIESGFFRFFHDMDEEGGRTADDRDSEVLDQKQLFFGSTSAHGDNRASEVFRSVVHSQASGEQAVAIGNHDGILFGHSPHPEDTADGFGPDIKIITGIAYDCRFPGCTARGMNPHDFFHRD